MHLKKDSNSKCASQNTPKRGIVCEYPITPCSPKQTNGVRKRIRTESTQQHKEDCPSTVDEIAVNYHKPLSGQPLTLEMFEVLKYALDKPAREIVVSGFSLCILREDLALLNDETEWLNDRNIDFYLELIRERSTRDGYPNVYIFHSFFYTLLTDKDGGYDAIQETTGEDDLFSYDIAFFPVNLNQHWRLVAVNLNEKTIKCYDSMGHDNDEVLKDISHYLINEYVRKHGSCINPSPEGEQDGVNPEFIVIPDFFGAWTVENMSREAIPQQKNAIDCGIFVLQFAEYLSREQEFDFDQTNIPYFRQRMMYETLAKQLFE